MARLVVEEEAAAVDEQAAVLVPHRGADHGPCVGRCWRHDGEKQQSHCRYEPGIYFCFCGVGIR